MTAVYVALLVVAVLVLVGVWHQERRPAKPTVDQVTVELHAIRRRFDVAWFRFQLGRDAADARRRLDAELRMMEDRERL
jgi:hypothetical protein